MRALLPLVLLLLCAMPAQAEDEKPATPDSKRVRDAIDRGAAFLLARYEKGFDTEKPHAVPELVLLTLSHAGTPHNHPVFKKALEATLTSKLRHTYRVSLAAMALSKINPYLYRARLAHCAQWLVDTQYEQGEWGYPGGRLGTANTGVKTDVKPPVTEEQAKGGPKADPIEIVSRVSKTNPVEGQGDFSNTQFALLGLRACRDARIVIPKTTWQRALEYQLRFQQRDGSWGYVMAGEQDQVGYASLTAAAAAGVAICHHGMGKKNVKSIPAVKKALGWLKKRWDPKRNVGVDNSSIIGVSAWQYYHLYAVERMGRILDIDKIGKRAWYAEGARWILANQNADGSWEDAGATSTKRYIRTADTCFAILFLSLATPPLTGR
ncbi:MAG: terpene cyclase/mutase family protein [Planctomycetota bacterium]|nr:terpene cyclase/mutase family protein [Planctomycetota bacterium]